MREGAAAHLPGSLVEGLMETAAGHHLHVSRPEIIARGCSNRCPNCGHHSLFPARSLRLHQECPVCRLKLDPGGGFWLGPLVINYTVTALFVVLPLLVLGVQGVLPLKLAIGLAVVLGGFGIPFLLYRASWSWWLMLYFFFFPYRLPANGAGPGSDEME
jgi:uncharacterized protein (DUF983 family)